MRLKKNVSICLVVAHLMTYIFPSHLFAESLADFSLLAIEDLNIKAQASVESGFVGVNTTESRSESKPALKLGPQAIMKEEVTVKAVSLSLQPDSVIQGDIYFRDFVKVGLNANIEGQKIQTQDFPFIDIPASDICSPDIENDIKIKMNKSEQLSAGAYGKIQLSPNSEIIFEGGRYDIDKFQTGPSAKVYFLAPTVLCVENSFKTGPSNIFLPHPDNPNLTSADIQINIQNDKSSQIGLNNIFNANIFAPKSFLNILPQTKAEGSFVARKIDVGLQTVIKAGSGINPPIEDINPPVIYNLKPAPDSFINNAQPQISGEYRDEESGIDIDSFLIKIAQSDETVSSIVNDSAFALNISEDLDEGVHNVEVRIKDEAGNESEEVFAFTIDGTPPNISGTLNPLPNEFNWNNTDVAIEFTCDDILSGVLRCPETLTITDEGDLQNIQEMAQDNAGNISEYSQIVNIDKTAPIITMFVPGNQERINTARPEIKVVYHDELSGIDPASVILKLNGEDLSSRAMIDEMSVVFTPQEDLVGTTFTTEITVFDKAGNRTTQAIVFVIDTDMQNQRPFFVSDPITSGTEGILYEYKVEAIDPDGDALIYSFAEAGAPENMTIDPETGLIQWVPNNAHASVGSILVITLVSDGFLSEVHIFEIVVQNINQSPVVVSKPVLNVIEGKTYQYHVATTDIDVGDSITFTVDSGPAGLTIDDRFGEILWDTSDVPVGIYSVSIIAKDSADAIAEQNFDIDVLIDRDLVIEDFDKSQLFVDGQDLTVSGETVVTIRNRGRHDVTERFSLTLFDDLNRNKKFDNEDKLIAEKQIDEPILSGQALDVTVAITEPILLIENILWGYVDSQGIITENNENNNTSFCGQSCESFPAAENIDPILEWSWTETENVPESTNVIMTPLVVDINRDEQPDIIFISTDRSGFSSGGSGGVLRAIDGATGEEIFSVTDPEYRLKDTSELAIGDIDLDGYPEIIGNHITQHLICFNHDGSFKWKSTRVEEGQGLLNPAIADLDRDGVPEIIASRFVYNNDGTQRWGQIRGGRGGFLALSIPLVADVNMDGSPETVTGNAAWSAEGILRGDWIRGAGDGLTAVANFDDDPRPEIVVVGFNQKVALLQFEFPPVVWTVDIPGGGYGSPTIADFDADGKPEIGVAGFQAYTVFDTDGSVMWSNPIKDLSSGLTGSSVFDFEGDGSFEVLFSDEENFYIFRGFDGEVLFETPMSSGTLTEYPVVADVDADGNAEIIVPANDIAGFGDQSGIYVFGGRNDSWVATREIWNQHTYHVTNVNEDGTIPLQEENSWEVHNGYRINTLNPNEVDYSIYSSPDLTPSFVRVSENEESFEFKVRIANIGGIKVGAGLDVSFFNGNPAEGGEFLGFVKTSKRLVSGDFEDIQMTLEKEGLEEIWIAVDYDAEGRQRERECNENNNFYTYTIISEHAPFIKSFPELNVLVNEPYDYTVETIDSDVGDVFTYELLSGPDGMTLNTVTGEFSWVPDNDDLGVHLVRLKVTDQTGLFDLQRYEVTVRLIPIENRPPQIISNPPAGLFYSDLPYTYQVIAMDINLDVLTYELLDSPTGMIIDQDTGILEWTPSVNQKGAHHISIKVSDPDGAAAIQEYILEILGNTEPQIITNPVTTAIEGLVYQYNVAVFDPDPNDVLEFSLLTNILGMSIDSETGLVSWQPGSADIGFHSVTVQVKDLVNNTVQQNYNLNVIKGNQSPRIGAIPDQSISGIQQFLPIILDDYVFDPDHTDDQIVWSVHGQEQLSVEIVNRVARVSFLSNNVLSETLTFTATDPDGFFESTDVVFTASEIVIVDIIRPEVTLSLTPGNNSPVGADIGIQIDAVDDIGVVSKVIKVDGQELPIDGNGSASFTSTEPGIFLVEAFAYDAAGNEGYAQSEIRFLANTGDGTLPTAEIQLPEDDISVLKPTEIIGSVFDDVELLSYRLEYAEKGTNRFVTINEGNTEIINDVLGVLDPTLMKNGIYDIRLIAEDTSGNKASVVRTYVIKGDAKVGNFTISFEDVTVPVAGIPITIVRTYDSRDKDRGDFGIGWTLSSNDIQIHESGVPGMDWEQILVFPPYPNIPFYQINALEPHYMTVTYPDGQVDEFTMNVTPTISLGQTIVQVTALFDPSSETFTKLQPIDRITLSINFSTEGDNIQLIGADGLFAYDPNFYKLTTPNGESFDIVQGQGIKSITDANGNVVQFDNDAIVHSSGKFISLDRDSQGRISKITDPEENTILYEYDFYGDLISVTDQENNVTQFRYDNKHNLIEIIDPRGIKAARNEYDNDGRLIATIDADGNRMEYHHDLENNQEVIIDRKGNITVYEYDDDGNIIRETNALNQTKIFTYDDRGNQLSETDALGNTKTSTYDDRDNLLTQTDALGHTTTYTYSAKNQLLTQTDPLGFTSSYTYDENGNLLTTTDALGNTTVNTYDDAGNLLQTVNPLGNSTAYTYDEFGNVLTEMDALGHVIYFTYDNNGNRLTERRIRTTSSGTEELLTTFEYDKDNRVVKTIDPLGRVSTIEYNVIGKESARVDAKGRRTEWYYDFRGNLIQTLFPDGTVEESVFDRNGNEISQTDRAGNITHFEYDKANRQIKVISPDGAETTTTYDAIGRQAALTDAAGNTTQYEYDNAGRNTQVTDALGNTTTYVYDERGNRVRMIDALNHETEMTYDAAGRLTETTFADGTTRTVTYDALGRQILETDQAGVSTQYAYDALGRLLKVTDALGGETRYAYDEVGNKITQIDANNHITQWTYDAGGSPVQRELPLGMSEYFVYDELGSVIEYTDFNNQKTFYQYDVNNRLIRKSFADNTTVEWTYTANGQRATTVDQRGTTVYDYDNRDRLVNIIHPDTTEISYTYDASGNRTSVILPSGITTYTYDALNRLSTVKDRNGGNTFYTYNAVGSRESVVHTNGTRALYTYDTLNRLTSLVNQTTNGSIISRYNYVLGPIGNRLSVTEHNGRKVDYTYDILYRLTEENISDPLNGNQVFNYTYDSVGNRLTKTDGAGVLNYTYDANDRLITEGSGIYAYDDNGNTLSQSAGGVTTNYAYDPENRLALVQAPGQVLTYQYDEDGIRVQGTVNGGVTNYVVDKNRAYAQVLEERSAGGDLLTDYVYGDDLLSQSRNGQKSFYHYDGLGSVRALTSFALITTDTYNYEAFGELLNQTGTTENNYLFTGEQYDPNIGFYYLRARYYMPKQGRFLNMDTWPGSPYDPQTLHKYLYTHADPVNNIDPSGNSTILESQGVLLAIATLASLAFVSTIQIRNNAEVLLGVATVLNEFRAAAFNVPAELVEATLGLIAQLRERTYKAVEKIRKDSSKWQLIIERTTGLTRQPEIYTPAAPPAGPFLIYYDGGGNRMRVLGARLKNRQTGLNIFIMRIDYGPVPRVFPGYPYTLHFHIPPDQRIHYFVWPEVKVAR